MRNTAITIMVNDLGHKRPKYERANFIFRHCAQGCFWVAASRTLDSFWIAEYEWDEYVWPLLQAHGYMEFHTLPASEQSTEEGF